MSINEESCGLSDIKVFAERRVMPAGEVDWAEPVDGKLFEMIRKERPDTMPETNNDCLYVCGVRSGNIETIYFVDNLKQAQELWDCGYNREVEEVRWYLLRKN